MNTRIYISKDCAKWKEKSTINYENLKTCDVKMIENGYILPYIKDFKNAVEYVLRGGVQSKDGEFVAGHRRHVDENSNLSCSSTYAFDHNNVMMNEEEVVYGGIVFDMFGHAFTESLCRMWYVLEHKERKTKIAFCLLNKKVPDFFYEFMELLGVEKERILIVDKIMGFRKIIIPEQALLLFAGYHKNVRKIYQEIAQNALSVKQNLNKGKKIYLSRAKHVKRGIEDSNNEFYFEQFYQKRGYEVIYPEKLSLCEQIAVMAQAEEVVCTGGTLSHMILFAKEGTKLTILLRCNAIFALIPQLIINQIKKLDVCIVDCSFNYLPTTHAGGVFLIGPTRDFIQYLREEKITFLENEIQMDFEGTAYKYMMSWIQNYNCNEYPYKRIKTQDVFDIINCMSTVLLDKPLTREQMATPVKSNVPEKEFKELKKNYDSIKENAGRGYLYRQAFNILNSIFEKEDIWGKEGSGQLLLPDQRPFFTYDIHFSNQGWVNGNGEYVKTGVAGSGKRIEAVRVDCFGKNAEVEVGVYVDKVGWKKGKNGEVVGTVGESKPVIGLYLKLHPETEELYDICYRVGNEKDRTKWCKNGEVTDTFLWEKIETLEIYLKPKADSWEDNWNFFIKQIKEDRERQQLSDEKVRKLGIEIEEFKKEREKFVQISKELEKTKVECNRVRDELGEAKEEQGRIKSELDKRNEECAKVKKELGNAKEESVGIKDELDKVEEKYKQEIESLNNQIYQLENSFSWRITKPLRDIRWKWFNGGEN